MKRLEVYIDNVLVMGKECSEVSYTCEAVYTWSARVGAHTATYKGYDWMGNVAVQTDHFTVS